MGKKGGNKDQKKQQVVQAQEVLEQKITT